MKISARNVLQGLVQNVNKGAVNAQITIVLPGGEQIVSIITNSSVDSLGLEQGKPAFAIVKASDVDRRPGPGFSSIECARIRSPARSKAWLRAQSTGEVIDQLVGGTTYVVFIMKESVEALQVARRRQSERDHQGVQTS